VALSLARRLAAETLGTATLLAVVVGSGIMGERLADGNDAVALLANAIATGAGLYVLISILGPISGAHFNPAVTLALAWRGETPPREAAAYVGAQALGAVAGVVLAHAMFGHVLLEAGTTARTGAPQWLSEVVATAGLLLTILLGAKHRPQAIPALVAAYITSAYWFTASTSFANPAVTLARSLTTTFAGIRPIDVPGFVAAELAGLALALLLVRVLADPPRAATDG
jgi:glycerol uptake facilitator-like aquaporin